MASKKFVLVFMAIALMAVSCTKVNVNNTGSDNLKSEKMTNSEGSMADQEKDKIVFNTKNPPTNKDNMAKDTTMTKSGSYKDYSASLAAEEAKAGHKVVLFFHAPWCPFCKAADAAFRAKLSEIPAGVTLLKTDYDSNVALKQKYGVTYQHTFVQIDAQNNLVSKWNGGDIDNLIKYLK